MHAFYNYLKWPCYIDIHFYIIILQPTDLEFVEVKERNIIGDFGKGYLHLNFLVKGIDGKHTMFFLLKCIII
jgi:hypothetical protein